MEWNRVFILDRWRMPSKYATQPWQQEQEQNLIYVAITRAKRELTYIDGKCWKD
jgi:DNA helicase-2/ATP-dependent DNA helicase PcrA